MLILIVILAVVQIALSGVQLWRSSRGHGETHARADALYDRLYAVELRQKHPHPLHGPVK